MTRTREQLPNEKAAVTFSSGAEVAPKPLAPKCFRLKQPMTVFDIDLRSARPCVFLSHFRPYFVRLPPAGCVLSFSPY